MPSGRWALALAPLVGLLAVVAATGKGLYVSPDAVFYVGTARNWLNGLGFTPPAGLPPVEHFPPLFTVVIAAFGRTGLDPLDAARVVNAVCLMGIVALVGLVVRSRTRSSAAALVASVLVAAATDLLGLSAAALSEPLFILIALTGLVVLAGYLDRPSPALLAGAGALAGAAVLTRYIGVALVVAGAAALLWRRRWAAAGAFAALGVGPVALWSVVAGGAGDRPLAAHLPGVEYLGQAARPLARWLVPWPGPPAGLVLAVALVGAGVALARRRPAPEGSASALPWLLVAFTVAYLAVLVANRTFADATGRLDARFLAPLHPVVVLLAVPALVRRRLLVLAVVLAAGQVAGAVAWTAGGLNDGSIRRRGYTAEALRRSPVMAHQGEPLHTNAVDAVFFVTGRPSLPIPPERDYLTGHLNPRYAEELAAMRAAGGYLAYFDAITFRRSFQPTRAELEAALPLEVVVRDDVGTLYRIR